MLADYVVAQLHYLLGKSVLITAVITQHSFFSLNIHSVLCFAAYLTMSVYYAFDENVKTEDRQFRCTCKYFVHIYKFVYN